MPFRRKKTLLDKAQDVVEQVSDAVLPQLENALEQTKAKAGPALADARERAVPLIAEGKAVAAEKAAIGRDIAAAKAASGRDLAAAKVAEIKGTEPEPKGGKLKKLLLLGGLAAIAAVVFKKLSGNKDSGNWQSSYVPTPPPSPRPPETPAYTSPAATSAGATGAAATTGDPLTDPLPGSTDDTGGGEPGEALSDSVEEPHASTTPDAPAEVIDVDDVPKDR